MVTPPRYHRIVRYNFLDMDELLHYSSMSKKYPILVHVFRLEPYS
eukprot:SAG11_NODE_1106_length_5841_cov_44.770986_2_plen_45_part_00